MTAVLARQRGWLLWLSCAAWVGAVQAQSEAPAPTAARQAQLVRMVRQDCGACHGMRLTGGLGPALNPERMALLPVASLQAVILHGRPGTPMPGWAPLLSPAEADWMAQRLQQGLPPEPAVSRNSP